LLLYVIGAASRMKEKKLAFRMRIMKRRMMGKKKMEMAKETMEKKMK